MVGVVSLLPQLGVHQMVDASMVDGWYVSRRDGLA